MSGPCNPPILESIPEHLGFSSVVRLNSTYQTILLASFVGVFSYLAATLGGALVLRPQMIWPLWPGCAFLVAVLLRVQRKAIWPVLLAAGLAGFALYDLQAGLKFRSIAVLLLADTVEVLVAALAVSYAFRGTPRLTSVRSLAKYSLFAVILAPICAAVVGANALSPGYLVRWKVAFLTESLALLALTPAILSWADIVLKPARKPATYYLEIALMFAGLVVAAYFAFVAPGGISRPALLYSVVPFLVWSALRFGIAGITNSTLVIGLFSIWGVIHGRGPFSGGAPVSNVLSLQLFFLFAASPFMFLAALVEERKDGERELRRGQERLRLATQTGKMYAYEWDVASDVVIRSEEGLSVLGFSETEKPLTRKQLANRIHPEDRALFSTSVEQLTPENPNTRITYRMMRPDGTILWLEKSARGFFNDHGKLRRMIGMVADVTERKRAEEAVLQREAELLQAQRVAHLGSWQWEPKTDVVTWSKELYRIAGRDPNLPPPSFREQSLLYTPESAGRLKCAVAGALRSGTPYELDLQMIRPDGSTRWIIDRGEVLRDPAGQIAWLRGTAQDITERKQAEDALRASEEKFRSVFRDAGVGMVIVSLEGRFLAVNDSFCECLGYSEQELLQKTVESVTAAEDWPSFSQRLRETLELGTSFQRVEKHCVHKSGRIVTTECSASLIRGPSGEPRYFVGEVLDITERKLAEEALSSVSRRLIEAHEEERTRIARELHDDINQRMALLAANLERVKETLPASDGRARTLVEQASQSVSDLGSDIQSLSHRLHSSKLEYLGLAAACAVFCREISERQNIEIDFQSNAVPKALPKEISLCLFRVLQEALLNAIKHSGTQRFEVALANVSNGIELIVHDSGIGFDPEKAMSGHGLGLTSMKERLKLVDGRLSIESRPHAGTTIRVRVPLAPQERSAAIG